MPVPPDFDCLLQWDGHNFHSLSDVRAICPHCHVATTFEVKAQTHTPAAEPSQVVFRLIIQCGYAKCRKQSFVQWKTLTGYHRPRADGEFFIHPSRVTGRPHSSIPKEIAEDWKEAQIVAEAGAAKSAAMMLRRVLYGVLNQKGCTLHPLKKGLEELIAKHRLPEIFDQWLPAIRDDGHDGAHPDRALDVPIENIQETLNYTAELLRFLYIEPHNFKSRQERIANPQPVEDKTTPPRAPGSPAAQMPG